MNITTNYRQNPFFTTVLTTLSTSMNEYSGSGIIHLYTYFIQTFIVSVLTCIVCVVCCMCRREDSSHLDGYADVEYTEYTLVPSSDTLDMSDMPEQTQPTTRVYSPIQSSSVEPILEPQSLRTTHRVHRVHRVHRTPRKPIPSRHTFAKSIEDLEYMV